MSNLGRSQDSCVSERSADRRPSPEDECLTSELYVYLMHFVEELPPASRCAFQLRDLDGLATSEAAQILGVAYVTVQAHVSRARATLRRLISQVLHAKPRSKPTHTALPVVARK
jgi:RNA polymerase sigma factor (sigma-70 family)